jgi:ABC-type multidrug transport system fused ATPase/permease subunit
MSAPAGPNAFRRHVWPVLVRHRWAAAGALVLTGIHGYGVALQNVYLKWFLDVLETSGLAPEQRWRRIAWLAGGYLVATILIRMACWHLGYRLFTWVRERIVFTLRAQFFRHVNHLCLRFHGQHSSGELFSYLFGSPLAAVMQFFQHMAMGVPGSVVNMVSLLVLFAQWDWVVALVILTASLLSVLFMLRARDKVQAISADFQRAEGDVSGRVADILRGTKAVKLYAMEDRLDEDFAAQAALIGRKSYRRDVDSHVEWMKQETFGYFCYALLMGVCTWRYVEGHITLGVVAACFSSFVSMQGPLQAFFQAFTLWGSAAAALERIGAVLDTPSTTPDPTQPEPVVPAGADIIFDRVTFGYDPARPVVRDLTFTIPRGQRVALVGPSGAGKSTIAQLLLRLYDPGAGAVRLGGGDLRGFAAVALRRQFGVVPQDPFIFRSTVRDNVRVARPEADDAAIRRACELANAWEFIATLPGGLDAGIGEGGSSLSGGQRQRLAIARALLADPQCFLFDEATSALDTLSESLIQQALERNLGGRTVIFIAHRLATVKNVDRILVIDGGRVAQDGSYDELIARPGLFADLVRGQTLRS